jgi:hypothetical protein
MSINKVEPGKVTAYDVAQAWFAIRKEWPTEEEEKMISHYLMAFEQGRQGDELSGIICVLIAMMALNDEKCLRRSGCAFVVED